MSNDIWKKIPFHTKVLIVSTVSMVLLLSLLFVSCIGSIDSYTTELDNVARKSSDAFAIKWQQDGELQEIYDFDSGEEPKTIEVMYLVSKKTVNVSGLTIGSAKLKEDITFNVIAIGLPDEDESDADESNDKETEIGSYTLKSGTAENNVTLDKTYVLPEQSIIILKFTPEISLEFVGVSWAE